MTMAHRKRSLADAQKVAAIEDLRMTARGHADQAGAEDEAAETTLKTAGTPRNEVGHANVPADRMLMRANRAPQPEINTTTNDHSVMIVVTSTTASTPRPVGFWMETATFRMLTRRAQDDLVTV
jgi:hypothetical protein